MQPEIRYSSKRKQPIGWWQPKETSPELGSLALKQALFNIQQPLFVVNAGNEPAVAQSGSFVSENQQSAESECYPLIAYVPALHPADLGDPIFKQTHNLKYAYVAGAMANGITSVEMVSKAGKAGTLGIFGAAGLLPAEIENAIDRLLPLAGQFPFGFNLIHSPFDMELEKKTVELYLKRGIHLVSASAYLDLTLPVVHYRVKGIHKDKDGTIVCPNKIIAKVSRSEVARKFLSPPPKKLLKQLVNLGKITEHEASLAAFIPMAEDLTAEADSGGHTDNRPAMALLPTIMALRDEISATFNYGRTPCVGLAGGIATPYSAAAAFAMGAAFILTGSINQACLEAGTSETVRMMLSEAGQADVTMAPAADMFEMGVKVQVLKRGTMFPQRAGKLYELYTAYDSFDQIPPQQRASLERDYFRGRFDEEWEKTKAFFSKRDPKQIELGENNPKHKMALVFRSYLGQSSNWSNIGEPTRKIDYQIWCGPAMGAFNQWVKGSFLQKPENRQTVTVALNLLVGAAVSTRVTWLRNQGIVLPPALTSFKPMKLAQLQRLI